MGRSKYTIRLITAVAWLLGIALSACCTELVLKDGTVCTGTIISEDAQAFMFQKGSSKLRINKLLVIRKDGVQYAGARVIPQNSLRPLVAQGASVPSEQSSATMSQPAWVITLKKGSVLTGRKISENKRVLVLETNGDSTTVFRNEIASIDSSGGSAAQPKGTPPVSVSQPVPPPPRSPSASGNMATAPHLTIAPQQVAGQILPKSAAVQHSAAATDNVKPAAVAQSSSPVTSLPTAEKTAPRVQVVSFDNKGATSASPAIAPTVPQPQQSVVQPVIAGAPVPGALPRPKPRVNVVAMSGDPAAAATPVPSSQPPSPSPAAPLPAGTEDPSGQLKVIAAPKFGFVAEKANRASADPTVAIRGGVPVSAPVPQTEIRSVDASVAPVRSQEPVRVSSSPSASSTNAVEKIAPLAIVQPPAPLPAGILPDPVRDAPAAPRFAPQSTAPAKPPMAQSPAKMKRSDGRQELVLMDGTVFLGKISSQTDRVFIFSSEGASITILKRLVKSIDGEAFLQDKSSAPDPAVAPPSVPATAEINRRPEKRVPAATVFRMLPSTELPQGYTVAMLIDSIRVAAEPKCRSRAARYCGAMGPWAVSAIGVVAQLLSDTAQSREAVPLLIDSSTVEPLLAPGLEAARALSQLGPQGEEELVRALSGNNRQVKIHAVFGLGTCFQESSEKAVKAALKDPDPAIRRTALGSLRVVTAQPLLLAALGDADPSVRAAAVTLLGKLADRTAVKRVVDMAKDNSQLVRKSTAAALGMFGVPEVSPALVLLTRDADNFVRAEAVIALGKVKDGATVDALITTLKDPTPDVRAGAVDALGSIRDSRVIPSLYAALKDENVTVRKKAQAALKLLTELPLLVAALDDESTTVRNNAAYVLWLMTGQGFGPDKEKWDAWLARKGSSVPAQK